MIEVQFKKFHSNLRKLMHIYEKAQWRIPKRGRGSKAIWTFSQKTSILVVLYVPCANICIPSFVKRTNVACHLEFPLTVNRISQLIFQRTWNLIWKPFQTSSNLICHFHICQFPACCELSATQFLQASRIKIKLVLRGGKQICLCR